MKMGQELWMKVKVVFFPSYFDLDSGKNMKHNIPNVLFKSNICS